MKTHVLKMIAPWLLAGCLAASAWSVNAEYAMTQGKGWRLCEVLHKELMRQAPRNLDYCPVQMLRSLPGVSEPEWRELDVTKHEDLLRRIVLYTGIGHGAYFDAKRRDEAIKRQNATLHLERQMEEEVENARNGLVRLRVARVDIRHAALSGGGGNPVLETIIRHTWHPRERDAWADKIVDECNRRYPSTRFEEPHDFIVKEDLSDFDETESGSVYFGHSWGNMVLYFDGKEYLVNYDSTGNGFTVMRDTHNLGYVGPICSIVFSGIVNRKGR